MQGHQQYREELKTTINLRGMIPDYHLLVRLDKVLNFDFIYDLTSHLYSSKNGRPSIDPVLFFRMQIINYLYGIPSDRQLCEEIQLNIAYRWFCRLNLDETVPDHSSLTKIRDRFGKKTYQAIFEKLILQWKKEGFIKGKKVIVDSSLVKANASLNSLVERTSSDPHSKELRMYEKRYHDFKMGKKQRKVSNQTHISKTDPDASLVSRTADYKKLCYKAHYSIDASSRFIIDSYATTGARHECIVLPERIDYECQHLNLPINELIADKGYGRGPTYAYLKDLGIRAYIPLHDAKMGKGILSQGEFIYDRKKDRYCCPEGYYLYPYEKLENNLIKRYRMIRKHCQTCELKEMCLPATQKHRARFIYRNPHQDLIDKIRKRQGTDYFKKKLLERKWKIEGLFGEAKENHCLREARYRGLEKFQIQLYMIALVQNFKRLIIFMFLLLHFIIIAQIKNIFLKWYFNTTFFHKVFVRG